MNVPYVQQSAGCLLERLIQVFINSNAFYSAFDTCSSVIQIDKALENTEVSGGHEQKAAQDRCDAVQTYALTTDVIERFQMKQLSAEFGFDLIAVMGRIFVHGLASHTST